MIVSKKVVQLRLEVHVLNIQLYSFCFCRILPSLFLTLPPQTLVFHLRTPTDWNQSHVCFAPLDLCAEHFRPSCWKIFLSCSTQTEEATSVSLASCDRLRKP